MNTNYSNSSNIKLEAASFLITVNGAELSSSLQSTLVHIKLEDEINVSTMFTIRFNVASYNDNAENIGFDIFKPSDVVSVALGFNQLQKLVIGLVTGIEANFTDEYSYVDVRCHDRLYLLNFGTYTRAFTVTDSTIASTIAEEVGLIPEIDSSIEENVGIAEGSESIYIYQNNQSNYIFLLSRCALFNYEMFVNDKTFYLRQSQCGKASVLTLELGLNINTLSLRLKILTMGSSVEVLSWNVMQKQVINATIDSSSFQANMGGIETGFQLSAQNFPPSATCLSDQNVLDTQQAIMLAQAQYNMAQNHFIEGEGQCVGNPTLRAGVNIQITEAQRFSGLYYVVATTHTFDINYGYITNFKIIRTGI